MSGNQMSSVRHAADKESGNKASGKKSRKKTIMVPRNLKGLKALLVLEKAMLYRLVGKESCRYYAKSLKEGDWGEFFLQDSEGALEKRVRRVSDVMWEDENFNLLREDVEKRSPQK